MLPSVSFSRLFPLLFNCTNSLLWSNPSVVIFYIFPCSFPGLLLHLECSFLVCCQKTHGFTPDLWFPLKAVSTKRPAFQSSLPSPARHSSIIKPLQLGLHTGRPGVSILTPWKVCTAHLWAWPPLRKMSTCFSSLGSRASHSPWTQSLHSVKVGCFKAGGQEQMERGKEQGVAGVPTTVGV